MWALCNIIMHGDKVIEWRSSNGSNQHIPLPREDDLNCFPMQLAHDSNHNSQPVCIL